MKTKTILIAVAALAVGAAAGWFAAVAANSSVDDTGRARCPQRAENYGSRQTAIPEAKPKRKAPSRSVESERKAPGEAPDEKPKGDVEEQVSEKKAKGDNPFPRYLDMFRNDPEALAAEFEKEAEADRARQREMRDKAIARLKLNAEQAAVFEKALDDLKNAILRHEQEEVDLIASGQMNMDTAADGRIWNSNLLLMDQCGADREKTVRDAAVELYNQLDVDSVSDSEKQEIIKWTTYNTSFSFDCYEPVLQVYDKVYKNMGFGKGIFSWCVRPRQKK